MSNSSQNTVTHGCSVCLSAGYFTELQIWTLIRDIISRMSTAGQVAIEPKNVFISGNSFILGKNTEASKEFSAPEQTGKNSTPTEAGKIWQIGATAYYLFMGCSVFAGFGGKIQTADSEVPQMRKDLPLLSETIAHCLAFDPANRPAAAELLKTAETEIARCKNNHAKRKLKSTGNHIISHSKATYWKEKMEE